MSFSGRPDNNLPAKESDPYRVMVVDDSAVIRGLISRMLETDPAINVLVTAPNGQMGVSALERYDVEIVVLDIEMPVMDGLTALPLMLKINPDLKVIMASTLTLQNADISLKAMELGATDYIPKPTSTKEVSGSDTFRNDLLAKIKSIGSAKRKFSKGRVDTSKTPAKSQISTKPAAGSVAVSAMPSSANIKLREASNNKPDIIAIGSSTGGPQALFKVFGALKGEMIKQPIVVTQHMPATFTKILAEHIASVSGRKAVEGQDGMVLEGGCVYVAPGGIHMIVKQKGTDRVIQLVDSAPENFCKPSVDPMFRSVAEVYGGRSFAIVLTGMGSDGSKGAGVIVNAGGTVIAQDEATSVVWGMPGATATSGVCSAVLPIDEIPTYIKKMAINRV